MTLFKYTIVAALLCLALSCSSEIGKKPRDLAPQTNLKGVAAVDHFIDYLTENGVLDKSDPDWKIRLTEPNAIKFDHGKKLYWILDTSKGPIKILLLPKVAPHHVTNIMYLTRIGFFDDLSFHRIIREFIMQGGCPLGDGTGSPGYRFRGEFDPKVSHDSRGIVSTANSGPNTDGSQFFITFQAAPNLNGKHTIFGRVVEGESTMLKIEHQGTAAGTPKRAIFIKKASIIEE